MTLRALKAIPAAAAVLLLTCLATAQVPQPVPQFTDPANLRGERVEPRDGRELPIDQGARGLEQMLRKLNTRASLMLIVAHPDDEDGGMLTYYSRGLGARVAVLTLTRGEGGQNAMTGDFEDALGLLRTQELLSADRYLGVDQFFGTEVDFGFSKTKEEAFKKWTHERVLYDAVRAIRLYRPLVLAAVFIGGVTDGHGQHQVSGQIAQEAFKAAADPTVFPDMIAEGILPWQALKFYARVPMQSISDKGLFDYATGKYTAPRFENYVTGEVTTTVPSSDVIVHEGTPDPLLSDDPAAPPRSYVQFARIGLGMQKSQVGSGMRVPPAGAFDVAYHLYGKIGVAAGSNTRSKVTTQKGASAPAALAESPNFFDGIDTSIEGMGSYSASSLDPLNTLVAGVSEKIEAIVANYDPANPANTAARLADALKSVDDAISGLNQMKLQTAVAKENILHELSIKRVQLNDAIVLALGLQFKSSAHTDGQGNIAYYTPFSAKTELTRTGDDRAKLIHECLDCAPGPIGDMSLYGGIEKTASHVSAEFPVVQTLESQSGLSSFVTRPYFHRQGIEQPVYELDDRSYRNAPAVPSVSAWAEIEYLGSRVTIGSVVRDGIQPISFVTNENIRLSSRTLALPKSQRDFKVSVFDESQGKNWRFAGFDQTLQPIPPYQWEDSDSRHGRSYQFTVPDSLLGSPFTITALSARGIVPDGTLQHQHYAIQARHPAEGYRPIGYGDLPRTNYYTPATVRIVPVDLNLPTKKKIAYLAGTGDAVPEALASISLKPDTLTVADLTPAKLAQYDTVILGVRTYAAHPDLHGAPTQALLDYARNGGNVLVQYQTTEFTAEDAPYPLSLGSNERVVDETDPVQLLDTDAPFLTIPNKITPADFNNWVEERGHGFLGSWDSHYTALTETHDPDEDPQRGGLITTNIGKGRWTYCAFALYRQLPEAVPGAFRLFVNLITPATAKN